MRWRLTRHLGRKKNISAQETSGIQVHQVKSIRLQRFLLLFHFSVQLGMVGLLNTLPGRSLVQFSRSVVYDSLRPHGLHLPGLPVHHQLLELAQTHVHRVSDAIQPSHALSSPSPPAFNLAQHQGLFQWVYYSHQVAKILEFQLQHQSFQWISGLISFRMDWFDLLGVQGTLKSLFQCHSSKASVLWEGERPPKTCHWKTETEFCLNSLFHFGSNHIINLVQAEDWSKERELGASNHISWAFATSETANFSWDTAWERGWGDSWYWSLPLISVKKF